MIARIIEISAKYRGFVVILYGALIVLGLGALRGVKLDAIPDLSDPQVIVFTEWKGQSPTLIEDQVTYPIASSLLAAPQGHRRSRLFDVRHVASSTSSSMKAPTCIGLARGCSST